MDLNEPVKTINKILNDKLKRDFKSFEDADKKNNKLMSDFVNGLEVDTEDKVKSTQKNLTLAQKTLADITDNLEVVFENVGQEYMNLMDEILTVSIDLELHNANTDIGTNRTNGFNTVFYNEDEIKQIAKKSSHKAGKSDLDRFDEMKDKNIFNYTKVIFGAFT